MTIANRPLNAFVDNKFLFRLSSGVMHNEREILSAVKEIIDIGIHTEKNYPPIHDNSLTDFPDYKDLSWIQIVLTHAKSLDLFEFIDFVEYQLKPQLENTLITIYRVKNKVVTDWSNKYKACVMEFIKRYTQLLEFNRYQEVEKLNTILEESNHYKTLHISQKSINLLFSMEVENVLIGMRQKSYVDDILKGIKSPKSINIQTLNKSMNDFSTRLISQKNTS